MAPPSALRCTTTLRSPAGRCLTITAGHEPVPASPRALPSPQSTRAPWPKELEASPAPLTCLTSPRVGKPSSSLPATPAAPATPVSPAAARRLRPLAAPAMFSSGEFTAEAVPAEDDALVSPHYAGLDDPEALEQAFRSKHPGLLEALAATAASLTPATAAPLLCRLEAELPPTLGAAADIAPSGDCIIVAVAPGLAPLLDKAADCCEEALADGQPSHAAATALAALSLTSCLRFSGPHAAAPYAAAAVRCKQALKAAYDAGAAITQEGTVFLYAACARASPWLWLTPYAGHRAAEAVDAFIASGWDTAEHAVSICESHAALTAANRFSPHVRGFVRLVHAAMKHSLSLAHVRRLLAAADRLPVEMRIQLGLHARSEPAADWHSKLLALQRCLEAEQACAARQALQPRQPRQLPQQQRPAAAQHSTQHKAPSGQHAAAGARTGDPAHVPVPARRLQHSS